MIKVKYSTVLNLLFITKLFRMSEQLDMKHTVKCAAKLQGTDRLQYVGFIVLPHQ